MSKLALRFASVVLVLASIANMNCYGIPIEIPSQPPYENSAVVARASTLRTAGMSREAVIETLGKPWMSSASRRVDVFFQSDSQRDWLWVLPAPVPFPGPATHYAAYTLVSYDTSGHVDAADAALIKDAEVAIARAGDYALQAFLQKEIVLLTVTSERFLRDWAATDHGTDCMLMIGTTTRASQSSGEKPSTCLPDLLRLDSGTDQKMDLVSSHWATPSVVCDAGSLLHCSWLGRIYPIVLAQGNHRLRFRSSSFDGELDSEVACRSGETIFTTLNCEVTEWYPWLKRLTWSRPVKWGKMTGRVAFSPEVPGVPEKVSYFVLLNKGGKWLSDED